MVQRLDYTQRLHPLKLNRYRMIVKKILLMILILFTFVDCINYDKEVDNDKEVVTGEIILYTLNDECKIKFNKLLRTIDFGINDSTELFNRIEIIDAPPFLMKNFYTQDELNNDYYFFKLIRDDQYIYLALSKKINNEWHEFYFIDQFSSGNLINDNNPFQANLSFLNGCSINIVENHYQKDTVISKDNIYLKKMDGLWFLDSVQNSLTSNLEYPVISINHKVLDPVGIDTVYYFEKNGRVINLKNSQKVLYDKVFVSRNKLILFVCNDTDLCSILYYSRE